MDDLQQVCQTLLDNADLDVSLDADTGAIELSFIVAGSLEQVLFTCRQFHLVKMTKDREDTDCLFVGETRVNCITEDEEIKQWLGSEGWTRGQRPLPSALYRVEVSGAVEIAILCQEFSWSIAPLGEWQRPQSYAEHYAPPEPAEQGAAPDANAPPDCRP